MRRAGCLAAGSVAVLILVVATAIPGAAQDRQAFARGVLALSDALEGAYGDERDQILGALDTMDEALAEWDAALAAAEAQVEALLASRTSEPAAARAVFMLGVAYFERGRSEDALAAFQRARDLAPGEAAPHLMLGLSRIADDPAGAAAALRTGWDLGATDPVTAYWIVHAAAAAGDAGIAPQPLEVLAAEYRRMPLGTASGAQQAPFFDAALFRDGASVTPVFPLVRYHDGFERILRREYDEAMVSLRRAAALDPLVSDPALRAPPAQLGSAELRRGRASAAVDAFRESVARAPDSSEASRLLAVASRAAGLFDESIAALRTAIRIDATNERAQLELVSLLSTGGRTLAVERTLSEMVMALPESGSARWEYAGILLDNGREPEALAHLQAIRLDAVLVGRGHVLMRTAQIPRGGEVGSTELLRRAVLADPNHAEAHWRLGQAYRHAGQDDRALASFIAAILIAPHRADVHTAIGQVHLARGRTDEGVAAFRRAVALDPAHADARYGLGHALLHRGETAEARDHLDLFRRLLAERTAQVRQGITSSALVRLAHAATDANRNEEAADLWAQIVRLEPDDAWHRLAFGAALARAGRQDEAIGELEHAIELDATAVDALRLLAELYAAAGRPDDSARVHAEYRRRIGDSPASDAD